MKRHLVSIVLSLMVLMLGGGCHPAYLANEPAPTHQYIRPLKPAPPQRVLGQYPGIPNEAGIITLRVVGKGIPPENVRSRGQAVLLAERAAVLDGYRQLSEKVQGVYVQAHAAAGHYAVSRDLILADTESWLRGAEVADLHYGPDGVVEASMRLLIHVSPDHVVYRYYRDRQPTYQATVE